MTERFHSRHSRLTVVRTGAAAAWTAPVVMMSAPASASVICSGGTKLQVTSVSQPSVIVTPVGREVSTDVLVCNTGSEVASLLSATLAAVTSATLFKSLGVNDWPVSYSSDSGGISKINVSAPPGTTIQAGECSVLTVVFFLANGDNYNVSNISFSDTCSMTANIDIVIGEGQGGDR